MIFSSSLELKVFLSARDYALSVQFYREVGFVPEEIGPGLTASATASAVRSCCRISTTRGWRTT